MSPGHPAAGKVQQGIHPEGSNSKPQRSHFCWRDWRSAGAPCARQLWLVSSQAGPHPQVSEESWSRSCPSDRTECIWLCIWLKNVKVSGLPWLRLRPQSREHAGLKYSITRASSTESERVIRQLGEGVLQGFLKRESQQVLRTLGDECLLNREYRNFNFLDFSTFARSFPFLLLCFFFTKSIKNVHLLTWAQMRDSNHVCQCSTYTALELFFFSYFSYLPDCPWGERPRQSQKMEKYLWQEMMVFPSQQEI